VSRGALWTARVLNALGVLFLAFDTVIKVLRLAMDVGETERKSEVWLEIRV
jgi:hypothetical protein